MTPIEMLRLMLPSLSDHDLGEWSLAVRGSDRNHVHVALNGREGWVTRREALDAALLEATARLPRR